MEHTKYPEDHSVFECLPQYLGNLNNLCISEDVKLFNAPIIFPKVSCGDADKRRCKWSDSPLISKHSMLIDSNHFLVMLTNDVSFSGVKTW